MPPEKIMEIDLSGGGAVRKRATARSRISSLLYHVELYREERDMRNLIDWMIR